MFFFLSGWAQKADEQTIQNIIGFEKSIFISILNVLRIFGTGVALIMLTWMSFSYFAADGRGMPWAIEKKADIKGTQLRNFAIGVAVFIGASNIVYFIANFVADIMTDVV